jgi:hypothetical protein
MQKSFVRLLEKCIDRKWDWEVLMPYFNISEMVSENIHKCLDWTGLSKHIDWEIVEKNPYRPWDWKCLSERVPWEIFEKNLYKPWDWKCLSERVPWEIVEKNPDRPWDWKCLSERVPWEIVEKNPDSSWDWYVLSGRSDLDWKFVEDHGHWPWHVVRLAISGTTYSHILKDDLYKRDITKILFNALVEPFYNMPSAGYHMYSHSYYDVDHKFTNARQLSKIPNVNWDFVERHIDEDWDWNALSENPNIDWDFVGRHVYEPWNWSKLSRTAVRREKEIIAVDKIQCWWLDVMYRPGSNYVKRVVQQRFESVIARQS